MWTIVSILAALGTFVAVYSYLSWLRAQVPVAGKLVGMVVAARDLAPGEVVGPTDVEIARHPEKYLPADAMRSIQSALGKTVAVPVFAGEALTTRKLGATGGISSVVPAGMRAYSLRIDSGGSSGFLPEVGDRVDIIVTFPSEVMGDPTTITVLRSKEVASIGESASGSGGAVADRLGLEGSSFAGGMSLTLFVSPTEAERLAMAEALGRITIVLAPLEPDDAPAPKPVRPADLGR